MFTITLIRKKEKNYDIASLKDIAGLLQDKHIRKTRLTRALLKHGAELFTLVNTLEDLISLVEFFPEQKKFTSKIVRLLRENPATFIKVVHTTAALQRLCLYLPELDRGQDAKGNLAAFMAIKSNAGFRAPLSKLVELLNLHLPNQIDTKIEKLHFNSVAKLTLQAYGNFYIDKEPITSVTFFLYPYGDTYCRLSLASKKLLLKFPQPTINTIVAT